MTRPLRKPVQLTEQVEVNDDLGEILAGLEKPQKSLSPKFFYDEYGSRLFDEICELPEYYLTNTELSIMQSHVGEMAQRIGPQASLIEFGRFNPDISPSNGATTCSQVPGKTVDSTTTRSPLCK